jgi:hypothetical protein
MATLKVRARANRLILDLEAMAAGARRYVGRQYTHEHPERTAKAIDAATKEAVRVDEPTLYDHRSHWPRHPDSIVSKPARPEYMRAVKNGDLLAADEATAKLCGVKLAEHDAIHKTESREEWEPEAPASADSEPELAEEHAQ